MLLDVCLIVGAMVMISVAVSICRRPLRPAPDDVAREIAELHRDLATAKVTIDLHGAALRDLVHTSEHQGEALTELIEANDDEHKDLRHRLKALERCTERV